MRTALVEGGADIASDIDKATEWLESRGVALKSSNTAVSRPWDFSVSEGGHEPPR